MVKKKTENVITHPVITIDELRKNGKKVDKKTKNTGVKQRVINILKKNSDKGLPMTQRMIKTALNDEVREQHINHILHQLRESGRLERFEKSVVGDDGIRRDLIYNYYIGK